MVINMRQEFILDKEWRFLPSAGVVEAQKTHSDSYNSSKAGQERGIPNMNFDDSDWKVVDLPHDYMTESEFSPDNLISHGYKGRHDAWYRKSFVLPSELSGKHIMLSFEGMAVTARVYVNGSLMGRSFSAYAPLDIDITDRAFFGDRVNTIAVYIDGLSTEGWWYEGSGIYRHVRIYVKEPLHIAQYGVFAKPVLDEKTANDWDLDVGVTIENSSYTRGACTVRTELWDGETKLADTESAPIFCGGDEKAEAKCTLRVENPRRWDIDTPELYTVKTILADMNGNVIDTDSVKTGFRTFTVDADKGFFLNGRPVKLMGTCNHQDHAGVGVAVPDSIQYYRIKRLKEMGTNAYRCSHNMPAKEILDACDELGMLVMDENRRFESRPEVIGHVEKMVLRDRNHPSVVMYSLFNEEPMQGTKEGGNIFRRMKSAVLRLDDTRLITGAMNGGQNNADGASSDMDVTGINYNVPGGVAEYHRLYPKHPVVGSENNSAISTRGCYKTDNEKHQLACYDEEVVPWGQLIKTTWKFTRENDWFGGIFIWTGFDYRGEPTPYQWPSIGSQFGIMDTCGFPKDSFFQNKACFTKEPMLHLLPHWNWKEGDTVRVMTASNCEEVELFLNGESLGRKKSDCCAPAEWEVKFVPGRLSAVAYNQGMIVARAETGTTGAPARVVIEPDRTYINDDGMDTVPFNLSVVDAEGRTVETAFDLMNIELIGDATLLGVGNGDPNCLESDHEPRRSLFAGHAQALIQSRPGAEKVGIKVTADGLESAVCELEVRHVTRPAYIYATECRDISGFTVSSETYESEPDPLMEIADNDMNSFEPVSFDPWHISGGFKSGYRIFRAFMNIPKSADPTKNGEFELDVKELFASRAKVFVDGVCVFDGETKSGAPLAVSFRPGRTGKAELRVMLEAAKDGDSGIKGGVVLRMK